MKQKRKSIRNDKRAFTGLEAAIVLTAFVVVAAVFSYVVLNAGFFTTQKAKQVVHSGVEASTSSVELCGDVIAYNTTGTAGVEQINITLALTAGMHPVNVSNGTGGMVISYMDNDNFCNDLYSDGGCLLDWSGSNDGDKMLEYGEKAWIQLPISNATPAITVEENEKFSIEVKPSEGATLTVERTIPPELNPVMNLH